MPLTRKRCISCRNTYKVYRGGAHDVQFYVCKYCRDDLSKLIDNKPYEETVKPKEEYL